MKTSRNLSVLTLVLLLAVPAFAASGDDYQAQVTVGSNKQDDQTNSQVGLEVQKKMSEHFAYGLMADRETQADPESQVGLGLFWQPGDHLQFKAGPAVQFKPGENNKTVLETGVEYNWNLKSGWQFGPEIGTNLGDGQDDSYNYGISVGKNF
jgi:outer membrane autotransporter protein